MQNQNSRNIRVLAARVDSRIAARVGDAALIVHAVCEGTKTCLSSSASGPLWNDCETLEEARDLANCNGESYLLVCVYDDAGDLWYETGSQPKD